MTENLCPYWGTRLDRVHNCRVWSLALSPIPLNTPNRWWECALRSTVGPLKRPDWCLEHLNWQLAWRSAKRSLHTDRINLTPLLRPTRSWELWCRLGKRLRSLQQGFPDFLLANPFLTSKITTYPDILPQVNMECPDGSYPNLKFYISELILHSYE